MGALEEAHLAACGCDEEEEEDLLVEVGGGEAPGDAMEPAVRALLAGLGEDDRREGMRRMPKRVAKAFRDGTRGNQALKTKSNSDSKSLVEIRGRTMQAKRRIIRYQVYKKVCRDQVWVQLLSGYNIETYTTSSSLNLKRSPSQGRPASGLPSLNPPLKAYRLGQIRPPSSIPFTRCGARLLHPRVLSTANSLT
ncbi:uncharacterized protein [Triticum aestivum]|uniref:uncharacterized protein isoform X2 n=1 Tax=Triticum aestivum TaxID=4565 RepID=UPI001D009304|nr:uncharacterized protein LOC123128213 isoform X2 [Triticum aestivum]